jgi:hypothetical protein
MTSASPASIAALAAPSQKTLARLKPICGSFVSKIVEETYFLKNKTVPTVLTVNPSSHENRAVAVSSSRIGSTTMYQATSFELDLPDC